MSLVSKIKECTGTFRCRFRTVLQVAIVLMVIAIVLIVVFSD